MDAETRTWMAEFVRRMDGAFGRRVVFLGLQGSRAREEAAADSDIDVVVVLERLAPTDLEVYRRAVETLPERQKLCGFVSGRRELAAWDRGELFQFVMDTVPLRGSLAEIVGEVGLPEARRAVRAGACAIYHGCCHGLLHGLDTDGLAALYKSARFVLRAKCFLETGAYHRKTDDLRRALRGRDRELLAGWAAAKAEEFSPRELAALGERLFSWAGALLAGEREAEGSKEEEKACDTKPQ